MSRKDVQELLMTVQALYPNFNPPNKTVTINAWLMMLSEYSLQEMLIALKAYASVDKSGFAPSTGQLISYLHEIKDEPQLNELEAWSIVYRAIRNSSYNSVDEFQKLPPVVQKAVGSPQNLRQWAIDENFVEGIVREDFLKVYRTEVKRQKEISKMPNSIRTLIEENFGKSYSAKIQAKNNESVKSIADKEKADISEYTGIEMPQRLKESLKNF